MRQSAVSEKLANTTAKMLVTAGFIAAVGEIARRILPADWELYVSLTTALAVAVGAAIVYRGRRE